MHKVPRGLREEIPMGKKKDSCFTKKDHLKRDELLKQLKLKTIDSPEGIWVPSMTTLIQRVAWALDHEKQYTPGYLLNLWEDIGATEQALYRMRQAMMAESSDPNKTLLMLGAAKESKEGA
jgi:hypothetical protein